MKNKWLALMLVANAVALTLSVPANAGKDDGIARIVLNSELGSLNFYFDNSRESMITAFQIYNGLVYRDPLSGEFRGDLAEEWSWPDEKTVDFKLRKNVKFSNGETFDADDVVFTIGYITDPANKIIWSDFTGWLRSAEKIDDYTVRLHLKEPYAMAMAALSGFIPIYPKDYYEKVGVSGMAANPVGTGPYHVTSVTPGSGYTLKLNPNYFEGPKARPAIETIEVRTIRDVNTQLAELMSGNLDFMWQFPTDIEQSLAATGQFNVSSKPGLRVGFIQLDAAGRTAGNTPLKDVRVRKAMNHAIDRQGIVDGLLKGSQVINSVCNPVQFGCETDVLTYDYNPEKAKKLLKEAGFADGFTVEMGIHRDRSLAEAMINNLAAVGIRVDMSVLQYSALTARRLEGKMPTAFMTWGSSSISDVAAITPAFFGLSGQDYAQDKEVAANLEAGGTTVDEASRKASYSKAFKRIAEQAYIVPLWTYTVNYALSKELKFEPTPDELLRFYEMDWN